MILISSPAPKKRDTLFSLNTPDSTKDLIGAKPVPVATKTISLISLRF